MCVSLVTVSLVTVPATPSFVSLGDDNLVTSFFISLVVGADFVVDTCATVVSPTYR